MKTSDSLSSEASNNTKIAQILSEISNRVNNVVLQLDSEIKKFKV